MLFLFATYSIKTLTGQWWLNWHLGQLKEGFIFCCCAIFFFFSFSTSKRLKLDLRGYWTVHRQKYIYYSRWLNLTNSLRYLADHSPKFYTRQKCTILTRFSTFVVFVWPQFRIFILPLKTHLRRQLWGTWARAASTSNNFLAYFRATKSL